MVSDQLSWSASSLAVQDTGANIISHIRLLSQHKAGVLRTRIRRLYDEKKKVGRNRTKISQSDDSSGTQLAVSMRLSDDIEGNTRQC